MNNQPIKFTDLANFQEKQKEAWYTLMLPECKYLLYGGAAAGGKSYWLRWTAIGLGMYYFSKYKVRHIPIGLFSEDYPTLKDRQVVRMKHEIPPSLGSLTESRDEGYAFIARPEYGSFKVLLRNLDDPSKYASTEFAAILVEELTKNKRETFDDLRFRLRYPNIDDVKFAAVTNPGSVGHGFVKSLWVKPDPSFPDVEQKRFFFIPAKYSDNKHVSDSYVKQLESLPEAKRRAFMDGDWDVFAGQYFSIWRDSLHVCRPFKPMQDSVIVGGLDWGRVDNFSFHLTEVSTIHYEGTHFYRSQIFYEAYGKDRDVDTWSDIIQNQIKDRFGLTLDDIAWVRADTQIFSKNTDKKVMDIYNQFKSSNKTWGSILKPANKDRVGGWENLQRWFSIAPDGLPYLLISSECPNAIRVIPQLIHDENKVEDVDEHGENDAGDSVRYLHMGLKWVDGKLGAIKTAETKKPIARTAEFVGEKQVSIELDAFWKKNTLTNSRGLGGVIKR